MGGTRRNLDSESLIIRLAADSGTKDLVEAEQVLCHYDVVLLRQREVPRQL